MEEFGKSQISNQNDQIELAKNVHSADIKENMQ